MGGGGSKWVMVDWCFVHGCFAIAIAVVSLCASFDGVVGVVRVVQEAVMDYES